MMPTLVAETPGAISDDKVGIMQTRLLVDIYSPFDQICHCGELGFVMNGCQTTPFPRLGLAILIGIVPWFLCIKRLVAHVALFFPATLAFGYKRWPEGINTVVPLVYDSIWRTKSQNLNVSRLVLQLSLSNLLKPGDAPTTSELSTISLSSKVWLILEVWRYIHSKGFLFIQYNENRGISWCQLREWGHQMLP